jgi:SAM-dependent methyltransferase
MALISTRYTFDFVAANLPRNAERILEIGCGNGALAALLQADGLEVTAIDSDPDAVAAAQVAGVDARLLAWPSDIGEAFDAILFTRSLHHIAPLDEAVAQALRALRPGGRIIVEDFRAEGGGKAAGRWFADLAPSLIARGALTAETSLNELIAKLAPDDHDLHSSSAIAKALSAHGASDASDAAYYFRYFEPYLRDPDKAEELLDQEIALIAAGSIEPLGKRFVADLS